MKNTTNLDNDGARWVMRNGRNAEDVFTSWGATKVYLVEKDLLDATESHSSGVRRFMLLLEDGWHSAHTDGTSCWASAETLGDLPNGRCAYAARQIQHAQHAIDSAIQTLEAAQGHERKVFSVYAHELMQHYAKK